MQHLNGDSQSGTGQRRDAPKTVRGSRQTLFRGEGGFSPSSRPLAAPAARPPVVALPVLEQLYRFAARMQGLSRQEIAVSQSFESDPLQTSREVVLAAARELGLDASFDNCHPKSLKDADFPCLVLLNDGLAYLATGLQNARVLLVEDGNGIAGVPFECFERSYGGMVLRLSPGQQNTAGAGHVAGHGQDVPGQQQDRQAETGQKDRRRLVSEILHFILRHNRARLVQLAIAAVLGNLLLVVLPLFIMAVYDRIIPHLAMETLWALAVGVLIALTIDFGLRVSRSTILEAISTSVSNDYLGRFYNRLVHLEMIAMPRRAGGLSGAMREFENLCLLLPQIMVAVAIDMPFFILLLGLLYYMGGAVVVAPILGMAIIAVGNVITYARARQVNMTAMELAHKRANQMIETLGAIETIKTTASEKRLLSRWEQRTDAGAWFAFRARQQSALASHLTIITVQATIVLTLIIGVYELKAGIITMGALAASSLLVGRAMAPMGNLIALFVRGVHLWRSSSAIEQVLNARQEEAGDRQKTARNAFKGEITFNNVGFAYESGSKNVLDQISFSLRPGERVGLIGRIGCGKSSLLKLLPRLHMAGSGSVLIDGHDIRQYSPAFLRRHIALMPQENVLLEGSLRENICMGAARIDEAEFERVVALAGVRDFASVHPQGYGMQVGARGERLSGGERASVVLARTLLCNPEMLLLDEPTAAMDNDLERRIVENLGRWLQGRTLVLATHRAPLLSLVDRIIWLHEGRIIADGPREEVLARLRG